MSLALIENQFALPFSAVTLGREKLAEPPIFVDTTQQLTPEVALATYSALLHDKVFMREWQPSLAHTYISAMSEQLDTLYYKFKPRKNKPRFEQWNAQSYIELMRNPAYRNTEILASLFSQNFDAFAAEYTRGQLVWIREYIFGEDGEILGLADSYQDDLATDRQGNFSLLLAEQQKNTQRAKVEDGNLSSLKNWITTQPLQSLFVWNSPPGTIKEGYVGTHSHSFTYLYHKIDDRKARVYQFRTWMPLAQHAAFQTALGSSPQATSLEKSHRIIGNTLSLTPPVADAELWAQSMITSIESMLYTDAENWRVNPNEMPVVDEAQFIEMRDFLCSLYIREVVPLLLNQVPPIDESDAAAWSEYLASPEYAALIKQLDTAFAVLAYQPLAKFVEETAENPPTLSFMQQVKKYVTRKQEQKNTIATLSRSEVATNLHRMYVILLSQKISAEDRSWFNMQAPSLIGLTNQAFSLGQCGLGTVINPHLFKLPLGEQLSLLQSIKLNNLSANQLSQLVGAERFKLWKDNQTCVACGSEGVWVGECGVCYACEYADSHGSLGLQDLNPANFDELASLSITEQSTLQSLFAALKDTLFVGSISFEQLLHNDFIDRHRQLPTILEQLRSQLATYENPLHGLVVYLLEVVQKRDEATITQLEQAIQGLV